MVLRVVLVVALVVAVLYLFEAAIRRLGSGLDQLLSPSEPSGSAARSRAVASPGRLVACRACGVHVPESRALAGPFCSEACRRRPDSS